MRLTRRHLLPLSVLACLPLAVAGCSHTTDNAAEPPSASSRFKVALLTSGSITDGGWDQSGYDGLQKIKQDTGAQVANQEGVKADEIEGDFREFASHGYNVVFGHGEEYVVPAVKVAPQFPNTVFITTGGDKSGPNYAPIQIATQEGTYLQGMEAAMVSKTGKGGLVGGKEQPLVKLAADAFAAGAHAVNPQFQFKPIYIDSWSDTAAAKAATEALLGSGADVIAHNCDAAAPGVFQAADGKPGVYTFGVNADQNKQASNVLSSAVSDIPSAFDAVAKSVQDHSFRGKPVVLGLKSGAVRLVDNPALASVIPPTGEAEIKRAEQRIIAGTLKVSGL